ncbi:hypothetical protein [Sphingobacterium sp.]|uniref:hypothetical protein n=1 Tax=Sphingobacterium sp. TaxID=341027 RepID=UPI0028A256C0|nr:hypothetical protein [Sphingobacterium sp.]
MNKYAIRSEEVKQALKTPPKKTMLLGWLLILSVLILCLFIALRINTSNDKNGHFTVSDLQEMDDYNVVTLTAAVPSDWEGNPHPTDLLIYTDQIKEKFNGYIKIKLKTVSFDKKKSKINFVGNDFSKFLKISDKGKFSFSIENKTIASKLLEKIR